MFQERIKAIISSWLFQVLVSEKISQIGKSELKFRNTDFVVKNEKQKRIQ